MRHGDHRKHQSVRPTTRYRKQVKQLRQLLRTEGTEMTLADKETGVREVGFLANMPPVHRGHRHGHLRRRSLSLPPRLLPRPEQSLSACATARLGGGKWPRNSRAAAGLIQRRRGLSTSRESGKHSPLPRVRNRTNFSF